MQRQKCDSRLLHSVGYDSQFQILEVQFLPKKGETDGAVYRYFKVPPDVAGTMLTDKSIGGSFLREIKGRYEYRKVEPDEATETIPKDF